MWNKCGRAVQVADDSMAHAHFMLLPKATNTYSEYVILIAFPQQQWLHQCASVLRRTYIGFAAFR
jgi:hypothetical protein